MKFILKLIGLTSRIDRRMSSKALAGFCGESIFNSVSRPKANFCYIIFSTHNTSDKNSPGIGDLDLMKINHSEFFYTQITTTAEWVTSLTFSYYTYSYLKSIIKWKKRLLFKSFFFNYTKR